MNVTTKAKLSLEVLDHVTVTVDEWMLREESDI